MTTQNGWKGKSMAGHALSTLEALGSIPRVVEKASFRRLESTDLVNSITTIAELVCYMELFSMCTFLSSLRKWQRNETCPVRATHGESRVLGKACNM